MPNVGFVRENIRVLLPVYDKIRDCIGGEDAVKKRGTRYLPNPDTDVKSEKSKLRYATYLQRAVFYNVAEVTQNGLVGQVFLRDPIAKIPALLEPVDIDATGSGVPLQQLAYMATNYAVAYGRLGLFVDYPAVNIIADGDPLENENAFPASKADIEQGDVRPTIRVITPWDCVNYRVVRRGAKLILSLVVFREDILESDDGFEQRWRRDQYRVLRLDDETGLYINEIYNAKMAVGPTEQYFPTDATGKRLSEIPFTFIGAINNDPVPDKPPMQDLVNLNLAHYRNSGDYEESVYFTGQATPVITGVTEEWVTKVLGGSLNLGSRGGISLPVGGDAKLLQAEGNMLAKEAMDQKEAQMLALGAKLTEGSQVERTATEADYDNIAETSMLSTIAKNVGNGFEFALKKAAMFVGAAPDSISYKLNTEFDLVNLSPEERKALIGEWTAGLIAFEEARDNLRRGGIATLSDADAKTKIAAELAEANQAAVEHATQIAAVAGPVDATGKAITGTEKNA